MESKKSCGEESLIDEIMRKRKEKKMANGGEVSAEAEDDFAESLDLEPVHTVEDDEHDIDSPEDTDETLIGQIMRDRKKKRMGK
jgi:hypothetical protein